MPLKELSQRMPRHPECDLNESPPHSVSEGPQKGKDT